MTRMLVVLALAGLGGCGHRTLAVSDGGPTVDRGPDSAPVACEAFSVLGSGKSLGISPVQEMAFSPDGKRLAVIAHPPNQSTELRVLEVPSLQPLGAAVSDALEVAWAGSNRLLVTRTQAGASGTNLLILDLNTGKEVATVPAVCGRALSTDGRVLWTVGSCTKEYLGSLCRMDLDQGVCDAGLANVYGPELAISADASRAAVPVVKNGGSCSYDLVEVTTGSAVELVAPDLAWATSQYLADGRLLWLGRTCHESGNSLNLTGAGGPPGVHLGSDLFVDHSADQEPPFSVSPKQDLVLAGAQASPPEDQLDLVGLALDGSGKSLLADDLYPITTSAMIFKAWRFTPDGSVLYTAASGAGHDLGLTLLRRQAGTWQKAVLSLGLMAGMWLLSPTGSEVALVEVGADGTATQLKLIELSTTLARVLASSSAALFAPRFLPDGRGLVFQQILSGGISLRYVPRQGGPGQLLGEWSSALNSPTALHPGGCAVVFSTDRPGLDTRIVPLPR